MQNLLKVITEYKEIALRGDSVGSSGKSLSSSNTCRIGSYNSKTANTAECFFVQRIWHGTAISIYCSDSIAHSLIAIVNRAFLLLLDLKKKN